MDAAAASQERSPVEICAGGERLWLLPERAVWWPRRSTLLVADLHLGKERALLAEGVVAPEGVLQETLRRLSHLEALLQPARVLVLGDLVHAASGLDAEVVETVAAWRRGQRAAWELIPGNHDANVPEVPPEWGITLRPEEVLEDGLLLRHDPRPDPRGMVWGGHLHPVVLLRGALDRMVLPCFLVGTARAVMPAFTRFSRGVRVEPEAGERVYALAGGAVVEVDPSACESRRSARAVWAATMSR